MDSWGTYSIDLRPPKMTSGTSRTNESMNSLVDSVNLGPATPQKKKNLNEKSIKKSQVKHKDYLAEQTSFLKQEYKVEIQKIPNEKPVEPEDKSIEPIRKALELKKKLKQQKIEETLEEQKKLKDLQEKIKTFEKQKKDHGYTFDYTGTVILVKKPPVKQEKSVTMYDLNNPLKAIKELQVIALKRGNGL